MKTAFSIKEKKGQDKSRMVIRLIIWSCIPALLFLARPVLGQVAQPGTVRVIYLVSQDRQMQTNYSQALDHAIRELQAWYRQQLNGRTFKLHSPVVEVAR